MVNDAQKLIRARKLVEDLILYLTTEKFRAPGNDYVHISTDLLPKLTEIRGMLR